jgi:predicted ATP-dependent endonuclease of OLD family
MRLAKVRVTEFKSVQDSGEFAIGGKQADTKSGDVTCLVGKNESGKTALLEALYRLNPIIESDAKFDVTEDYPRNEVEDYLQDLESKKRTEHTSAIRAVFTLDDEEVAAINADFADGVLTSREVVLSRGYTAKSTKFISVPVHEGVAVKALVKKAGLPAEIAQNAAKQDSFKTLATFLATDSEKRKALFKQAQAAANAIADESEKATALAEAHKLAESDAAKTLRSEIAEIVEAKSFTMYVWDNYLEENCPRFLYFDEYYQMTGQVNVQKLKERETAKTLLPSDRPMFGLIELARLKLDELMDPQNTQQLKNKLQGASNYLSKQILKYWSQNKHLHVQFDVRPALPKDPPEMNQAGTMNLWGEVYDSAHGATLRLGTRSKGFVWFFSFLAWFSQQSRRGVPLILLLDEPGLVLHASAQGDLLNYIETELKPHHQVIYTTHSPFMVDMKNFDRVRIVRDRSMEEDDPLPKDERGTKVFTDILEADPESLFPLQGALGYDIAQTLFVGANSLIVEGVSDLLFLPSVSGVLESGKREGLREDWTITPVGGSDKVPTFVSLLGSQKKLNVATLIDFQKKDQQAIENLYKKKLLEKKNVRTFADFTGTKEADLEDMFDRQFYLDLVNAEYAAELQKPITLADLGKHPRILVNIEEHLKAHPLKAGGFNHYRPARYFVENIATLGPKLGAVTLDRFEAAFKALNALL